MELIHRIQRHDLAAQAAVDHTVTAAAVAGGRKAHAAYEKTLKGLRE